MRRSSTRAPLPRRSSRPPRWSPTPSPDRGQARDTARLQPRAMAHRLLRTDGMRVLLVAALALVGCSTSSGGGERPDASGPGPGPGPAPDAAPVVDAPPPVTPDDPGTADVRVTI